VEHEARGAKKRGWKNWLWMIACCVPMVAIIVLLALGYWSSE